jgi:hypothetical protein
VMAAGCNAHGVSGSAGIARHVLESMGDSPSAYVRSLSPDRFAGSRWSTPDGAQAARHAAARVYQNYYALPGGAGPDARIDADMDADTDADTDAEPDADADAGTGPDPTSRR